MSPIANLKTIHVAKLPPHVRKHRKFSIAEFA